MALQQLPCPLAPELSNGSLNRGWASNTTTSSNTYLQVSPLLEGSAAAGGTTAWQDQQQQQQGMYSHTNSPRGGSYLASPGAYASGVVSYSPNPKQGPAGAGHKTGGSHNPENGGKMAVQDTKGGQHAGGGMALMQHAQQRQRGVSGPGDEAARLPDQNLSGQGGAEVQGAALMVSLEGWAASPTRHRSADIAMVGLDGSACGGGERCGVPW